MLGATVDTSDLTLRAVGDGRTLEATSSWIDFGTPFFQALVSFNADVPADAGIAVDVRVGRVVDGVVQGLPWLRLARWGEVAEPVASDGHPPMRVFIDENGASVKIDVDYLRSMHLWDRLQWRVRTFGANARDVRIVRVAACATTACWSWDDVPSARAPAFSIDVPFRTQKTMDPDLAGRACSPTSLSMVLAHHGNSCSMGEVAKQVLDPDFHIYGNWVRNIQGAYTFGSPGVLMRMPSMERAEAIIRAGHPIIASIMVEPNELRGSPYRATDGHLIVLRGVDEVGHFLVNDPAAPDAAAGQLTYRRDDLRRVWLRNTNGTAYVLFPRVDGEAKAAAQRAR